MAELTVVGGIVIPSTSLAFLGLVAVHVGLSLVALGSGTAAIMTPKAAGRHPRWGTLYYWTLAAATVSALVLAGLRWREDFPLALLGVFGFVCAAVGRRARTAHWTAWIPWHVGGMGASYVLMLTAFYVDNGRNLPLWKLLPPISYWLLPSVIGGPVILWAIRRRLRSSALNGENGVPPHPSRK